MDTQASSAAERSQPVLYKVGEWIVRPDLDKIERRGVSVTLEPRAMDILVCLIERAGEVISNDDLADELWAGQIVSDNTLYQWLHILRKALGDDPHHPGYIETIPKKGYRLIARVEAVHQQGPGGLARGSRLGAALALTMLAALVAVFYYSIWRDPATQQPEPQDAAARETRPSIAVLPFVDLSNEQAGVQYAEAIHEEILTMLARLKSLRVISRTSVMAFKDAPKSLPDIRKELGVTNVLEGSVQKMGNRLHVNIQLLDARTDEHLWAQSYERELTGTNLFAVQAEIAGAVAENLDLELSAEEQARISRPPTPHFAAYEAYLMGRHHLAKRIVASMDLAVEYFQKAIKIDPDYALAHVGLADAYLLLSSYSTYPDEELLPRARESVDRALELDDRLGEAYATLGQLLSRQGNGRAVALEKSANAYRRSIELNPNYAQAYHWYSGIFLLRSQPEAALVQLEKARELDPMSMIINSELGHVLERVGRFEEARRQYEKVISIAPDFLWIYRGLAFLEWTAHGRVDRAVDLFNEQISLWITRAEPPLDYLSLVYGDLARSYMDLGDNEGAERWIERGLELESTAPPNLSRAYLRLFQGEKFAGEEYPAELQQLRSLLDHPGARYMRQATEVLRLFRNYDLASGRYQQARNRYERYYPELLSPDSMEIDRESCRVAVDLAFLLHKMSELELAERLRDGCLQVIAIMPRMGLHGYWLADVMIHAQRGANEKALSSLRQAIDAGWRYGSRYFLEHEPSLFPLHGHPEYQAMVAEVHADLAGQLEQVRRNERAGDQELPTGPDA